MKRSILCVLISAMMISGLTGCSLFQSPTSQPSDNVSESDPSLPGSSEPASSEQGSSEADPSETSEPPESGTEDPFVIEGIYRGVDWGDYLHLNIEDDDGVLHSFFVLRLSEDSVDVEALEEGTRIRIKWETSVEYLDPPGEEMEVDHVTRIELLEEAQG